MKSRYLKFLLASVLILLFNNCGQGFKALKETEDLSSEGCKNNGNGICNSPTPTLTPVPSATPTATPTSTPTPRPSATPTATPRPSATPSATPTATPRPSPTPTPTPRPPTPTPTPTATPVPPSPTPIGSPPPVSVNDSWNQRRSAAGVVYAESFEFADKAELMDAALGYTNKPPANEIDLENNIRLSGSHALKLITYGAAGGNGGSWANYYNGRDGTNFHEFYFQFAIYLPKETLSYRSLGGDGQLKLANLEQYGNGQVVVTNKKFFGFPSILINGNETLHKTVAESVVPNVSSEEIYQPAVFRADLPTPTNACSFWKKYGPARGIAANEPYGYDAANPWLHLRNMPNGWPNQCALESGVPYNLDGWTVIEVYVKWNPRPALSTIKAWAAPYGQAPRIFVNEVESVDLGGDGDVIYRRFELLNYDTPRESEATRPTLYTYFDEVIVSTKPVNFPGNFTLPNLN